MRRNKILLPVCFFMVAGLSGCEIHSNNPVKVPVCTEHQWEYKSIDKEEHHEVCKVCEVEKENSIKKHHLVEDLTKAADNKASTCFEAGYTWHKCTLCDYVEKQNLDTVEHSFTVIESTTATCTDDGENTMECKWCGVESPVKIPQEKLEHNWVPDTTWENGLPSTCTGKGTAREKCTRCTKTLIVEVPELGHSYLETIFRGSDGFVDLNYGTCQRTYCSSKRISWKATNVNNNCKNNMRSVDSSFASNPNYVNKNGTTYEPNYVTTSDDGVKFWGRPMHNAMELGGTTNQQSIYDATVEGSFIEYDFKINENLNGVVLVADMNPVNGNPGEDVFKASSGDTTPGLVDSENNKCDFRLSAYVDGTELTLDDYYNSPSVGRGWYRLPCTWLNLSAGNHTVKIVMTGGKCPTFYKIGFESILLAA